MKTSFLARPVIGRRVLLGHPFCASPNKIIAPHISPHDHDIRPVYTLLPHPFPSLIALVPKRHVAVLERFGKYRKKLENGVYFIIPFLDRITTSYKNVYEIEGIEDYEVGGTLKIKIDDVVCPGENSIINNVGYAIRVIGDELVDSFKTRLL